MVTRIVTAVVALAIFLAVIFAGEIPLEIGICLVILAMLYEIYGAVTKSKAVKTVGFLNAVLFGAGLMTGYVLPAVFLAVIITMITVVALHGKVDFKEVTAAQLLTIYIVFFMLLIPQTRISMGLEYMALIFIIAWGSDTAAYFCGTFFGRHKLIPHVSPKKTVEGSVGALVCVMLICMLYAFIMNACGSPLRDFTGTFADYAKTGALAAVAAAFSQVGDLAASAIKRDAGIKDYGKIFPGHGGFMDRFDSVIFITPIVYYYGIYFM